MIELTFGIASIVIAEAGLSFLGLGIQAPEASWGSMIRDGAQYLLMAPHMVLVPGGGVDAGGDGSEYDGGWSAGLA